jgi:hypothetical protein
MLSIGLSKNHENCIEKRRDKVGSTNIVTKQLEVVVLQEVGNRQSNCSLSES